MLNSALIAFDVDNIVYVVIVVNVVVLFCFVVVVCLTIETETLIADYDYVVNLLLDLWTLYKDNENSIQHRVSATFALVSSNMPNGRTSPQHIFFLFNSSFNPHIH
jgi:hypothetical protein